MVSNASCCVWIYGLTQRRTTGFALMNGFFLPYIAIEKANNEPSSSLGAPHLPFPFIPPPKKKELMVWKQSGKDAMRVPSLAGRRWVSHS